MSQTEETPKEESSPEEPATAVEEGPWCPGGPDPLHYLGCVGKEETAKTLIHREQRYLQVGPYCFPINFCPWCAGLAPDCTLAALTAK